MTSVTQALVLELSLGEPSYFIGSKVTLYWIKGQKKEWKPFVQNHVNQIWNLTQADQWARCAGKENPADIPFRGINPIQLNSTQVPFRRSRRVAAKNAREIIRIQNEDS